MSQKLKDLIRETKELMQDMENLKAADFHWRHDEDYNLFITFGNGETIKLPIINYRPYQLRVQRILFSKQVKRILLQWPRRAGKEVVSWNTLLHAGVIDPGMYIITYPTNVKAKKILWQGAALINGVSTKFLDMVPKQLLAKKNDTDMTLELVNGTIIWVVGCDIDPEKLRGTNPRGVILSELAFSDPRVMHTLYPILRENGGWMLGQSTFDGMNHFYRLIQNNKNDPLWHCEVESIVTLVDENGNRYITDESVDEDRRGGMPEYLIQQEYYGNVQINEETKYFAIALNYVFEQGRIISELILPSKNVYAFYDIGVNDCTSITLAQFESKNNKLYAVVIGYVEKNNRDLTYYVNEIRKFCASYNLPFKSHFIPHDGKNRNWNDNLKNTCDYLSDMGEVGHFVNRPSSHKVAIEAIRKRIYQTKFNKENTERLVDCLSNYEKEFDDKMGKFKDTPIHNWASHGVKSFQTMVLALDAEMITENCYDVIYMN